MKKILMALKVLVLLCGFAAFNVTAAQVFFEDFESGWGGWYADNGVWEVGTPTAVPPAPDCHEGVQCAGTILDGDYPDWTDSRLISPYIVLPYISNNQGIFLRFWHWFAYNGPSKGIVQIKYFDENTGLWSEDWETIHTGFGENTSPVWSFFSIDISQYSGKKVQFAFYHTAEWQNGLGWYIDEVEIISDGPLFWSGSEDDVYIHGDLGIGTEDPQAALDVRGDIWSSFEGENTAGDGLSKLIGLFANNSAAGKSSDVGFALINGRENFQWNFRTFQPSEGFVATKEGTGGPEMVVSNLTNDYHNVSIQMGNGATLSSNGNWLNASSKEYKEEIEDITANEAIMALKTINPVKYKYKRDINKELKLGFIAEDVPDLVATRGRKNMDTMEVVAMLTKVVQEQQKTIIEQRTLTLQLLTEVNAIKRTVTLQNKVSTEELFKK